MKFCPLLEKSVFSVHRSVIDNDDFLTLQRSMGASSVHAKTEPPVWILLEVIAVFVRLGLSE